MTREQVASIFSSEFITRIIDTQAESIAPRPLHFSELDRERFRTRLYQAVWDSFGPFDHTDEGQSEKEI